VFAIRRIALVAASAASRAELLELVEALLAGRATISKPLFSPAQMVRWLAALGFVALALTASAGATTQRDALIRPGIGIGKVKLGMSLAQVRTAWGAPQARIVSQERGARKLELQYDYAAYVVTLRGDPRHERVVAIGTTLAKERTSQGVGVGSLERRLQGTFRSRLRCDRLDVVYMPRSSIPMLGSNERRCTLGTASAPHTVFTSRIRLDYAWDQHPPDDWSRLARVTEVVIEAPVLPERRG